MDPQKTLQTCKSPASNGSDDGEHLADLDRRAKENYFRKAADLWEVKDPSAIRLRLVFVVPIVLLGILGNSTIIYSMCRFKRIRSKPTNIFILNMALADLLTTIVCPNAALFNDIYQFYVLGPFICRTEGFIKITLLLVSAYSLIVLSFDWFLSVVRPCRTRINLRQSWLTVGIIWLISVLMAAPLMLARKLRERQWLDVKEVWCCEDFDKTKYYWVFITIFLILPTLIMTIALTVIIAQMDRYERKLRQSRCSELAARTRGDGPATADTSMQLPSSATTAVIRSSSFSINLDSAANQNNPSSAAISTTTAGAGTAAMTNGSHRVPSRTDSLGKPAANNSSLSISMKYRRRIVKILFFYLLTSIVCWTPLQVTTLYRLFKMGYQLPDWFYELKFFTSLCASLSAAMNPIIFGFLSQPFRQIIVRSWLFRLLYKLWAGMRFGRPAERQAASKKNNNQNNGQAGGRNNGPEAGGGEHAMSQRPVALVNQQPAVKHQRLGANNSSRLTNIHIPISGQQQQRATRAAADNELSLKLTIDYVDHHHQMSSLSRSAIRRSAASQQQHRNHRGAHQQRPKSVNIGSHQRRNQHQHQHQHHNHRHQNESSSIVHRSHSSSAQANATISSKRSLASEASHQQQQHQQQQHQAHQNNNSSSNSNSNGRPILGLIGRGADDHNHHNQRQMAAVSNSDKRSSPNEAGVENRAYTKADDDEEDDEAEATEGEEERVEVAGDGCARTDQTHQSVSRDYATTSFMVTAQNGAVKAIKCDRLSVTALTQDR